MNEQLYFSNVIIYPDGRQRRGFQEGCNKKDGEQVWVKNKLYLYPKMGNRVFDENGDYRETIKDFMQGPDDEVPKQKPAIKLKKQQDPEPEEADESTQETDDLDFTLAPVATRHVSFSKPVFEERKFSNMKPRMKSLKLPPKKPVECEQAKNLITDVKKMLETKHNVLVSNLSHTELEFLKCLCCLEDLSLQELHKVAC